MSDTYADAMREQYARKARQIVQGLRDIADRVEREADPTDRSSYDGTPRHTAAASRVHHELAWGIANLGSYHLIGSAERADAAEREEQS